MQPTPILILDLVPSLSLSFPVFVRYNTEQGYILFPEELLVLKSKVGTTYIKRAEKRDIKTSLIRRLQGVLGEIQNEALAESY